ncbi:guanylin-like [Huso huso]|uniref:Guanylate cyclase activator 2B n=1 Tax=Huso huso TaxID=61971 RepID=A0ABR0YXY8_HUSHU
MKAIAIVFIIFFLFVCNSGSVKVVDGDFTFSLEAVKKLKDLMDGVQLKSSRMSSSAVLCANPALPEEFRAVCQSTGAGMVFSRLETVADHADICEICAMAACTGCV